MTDPPTANPEPAALALRLHFLFEAERLGLLPAPLSRAVQRLAAAAEAAASDIGRPLDALASAFCDGRQALGLGDLTWPSPPGVPTVHVVSTALSQCAGEAASRAAAERLGRFCEALVHGQRDRRATGSYYTPGWIADHAAATAVQAVLSGRRAGAASALSLRILDPALGAGAFAVAAVEAVADAVGEERDGARRVAVRDCIFGVEMSPLAAEAARLALWLAASRPQAPAAIPPDRIVVGDALASPPAPASADIVLGNPPWGVKLPPRQTRALGEDAPHALSGHRDSAIFFLHLAARAAVDDGAVGMLLPDALLSQVRCEGVRRSLLERFRPLRVVLLGDRVFPAITAPTCLLCLAGAGVAPEEYEIADLRRTPRANLEAAVTQPGLRVPRDAPMASPHHTFVVPPGWLVRMFERLAAQHPSLGGLGKTFQFADVGINYPRADIGRTILYQGEREDARDIPVVRGRDFGPFTAIGHSAWLRHDWRERLRPGDRAAVRDAVYRATPKLILRQTGDRPVATLDREGVWFGRSVIAITAPAERDLLWLAAVLNSRAFAALYRTVTPEAGRSFAQVKVNKLKLLPVAPDPDRDLADSAAAVLAEGDPDRRAPLIAALDAAVSRAYRLTEDEVGRVEQLIGAPILAGVPGRRAATSPARCRR